MGPIVVDDEKGGLAGAISRIFTLGRERRQEDLNRINELERKVKELEREVISLKHPYSSSK